MNTETGKDDLSARQREIIADFAFDDTAAEGFPVMMFEDELIRQLQQHGLTDWAESLRRRLSTRLSADSHGDFLKWSRAVQQLPVVNPSVVDINTDEIRIGAGDDIDADTRRHMERLLKALHPWRKGPFNLFGIHIDTEWRSDRKWQRIAGHIQPLSGRTVLDIGCGSGYHCWRMRGAGAELVLGIDPTLVYAMQFRAMQNYIKDPRVHVLPIGIEDLPEGPAIFDTVFSMGLLHHRRSPIDHLYEIKNLLKPGGELVLETLVIEGDANAVLVPADRYARMRNVWFIPSCDALSGWLQRCAYREIRLLDVSTTTMDEQRATEWMTFKSLKDFLDPDDPAKTVEGYPAPRRAVFTATR